jgi:phosphoglycolate phosphatase-like HAD superfamily hydrolase
VRPTVLLFDIDGTLITTGGVGRRAMERTFEEEYGNREASQFRYDGMTDRQIMRQALTAVGVEPTEATIAKCIAYYLTLLAAEVAAASDAEYRLHTGMMEALRSARERGHAIGLGTGNVIEGARIKLERVGVFEEFAFGGFGSDAEDRTELIRHGAARGARHAGAPLAECRVVIIGDTPKDVAAARDIGAECIGVGTGRFTPEALLECGATHAFPSLDAPGALAVLLG